MLSDLSVTADCGKRDLSDFHFSILFGEFCSGFQSKKISNKKGIFLNHRDTDWSSPYRYPTHIIMTSFFLQSMPIDPK